jgi:hypothetical protein
VLAKRVAEALRPFCLRELRAAAATDGRNLRSPLYPRAESAQLLQNEGLQHQWKLECDQSYLLNILRDGEERLRM